MTDTISRRHLIVPTPFGEVAVIYRENPFLILEVVLPCRMGSDLSPTGSRNAGPPGEHEKARLIGQAIRDYFRGKPLLTPWPWLAVGVLTRMQQEVLKVVASIPYGRLSSYKQVAEAAGCPKACRATGTALAKNPFPLLIPCHRVIRSDGTAGLFGGGTELKSKLIHLEARTTTTDFDDMRTRGVRLVPDYHPVKSVPAGPRG